MTFSPIFERSSENEFSIKDGIPSGLLLFATLSAIVCPPLCLSESSSHVFTCFIGCAKVQGIGEHAVDVELEVREGYVLAKGH